MRALWVVILGVAAMTAVPGCKRREPEPIPGPKSGPAMAGHARTPGIAWFQGSIDEAFARTRMRKNGSGATCPVRKRPGHRPRTPQAELLVRQIRPPRAAAWYNSPRLGL